MNIKNLNPILLLLTYFATQHDVINAMKRPHTQISNTQQNKQLPPTSKKTKLNNKTAAFLCTLCNKNFSTSSNLSTHKKIHTGEKSYSCDICHKSFTANHNLITHQRAHNNEKSYKCDVCDKAFSQKSTLTIHQRTHTDEKPYSCDICHKSFTANHNLITHQRTHTGEKPYSCDICHKSFTANHNLIIHQRTHTKIITPTISLTKNNTEPMLAQMTKNISLKSFNTPTDYRDIIENIMTLDDTKFNEWLKQ